MVRLLNGTSFEPGMYGFSSNCFPMQEANLLARGTFFCSATCCPGMLGLGDMA